MTTLIAIAGCRSMTKQTPDTDAATAAADVVLAFDLPVAVSVIGPDGEYVRLSMNRPTQLRSAHVARGTTT